MQQLLIQQIDPKIPTPGAGVKSFSDKPDTRDNGFENVLKGILGAKKIKSASPSQPAAKGSHEISSDNAENQQELLNSIIKKFSAFLKEKNTTAENQPIDSDQLNNFLSTSLTNEEMSFLLQFLQQTGSVQNSANTKNTDLLHQLFDGNKNKHGLLQNEHTKVEELGELIAALNKVIEAIKTPPGQTSMQQVLSEAEQIQKDTKNSTDMLIALRDKLRQMYDTFTVTSQSLTGKHITDLKTSDTTGTNTEKTAATNQQQQLLIQTSAEQPKQTEPQSDNTMLKGIEQFFLSKQALQKLSASKDTANISKQENMVNSFLGTTSENTQTTAAANGQTTLSLLYQAMGNKEYLASFQPENKQTLDQVLTKLKMMSTLSSAPEIAVKIESTENQPAVKPVDNTSSAGDKGLNASTLLKDAVINQSTQQSPESSNKADSAGTFLTKTPVNSAYVIEQLTDKINMAIRHGEQKLSIQLYPPSMGKLNVDLSMKNNHLRAVIIAETPEVKQLLQSNMDQLKTCLESQNIKVENVSVMVGNEGPQQQFDQYASHLHDHPNKGKKNGFYNILNRNTNDDTDSITGIQWNNKRSIIQTDMVDVFA
ncbi:MAG: flagellar hook-length control protein FliK [Pseudomonadota bacterium]